MEEHIKRLVDKKKALGEKADYRSKSFNDIYGLGRNAVAFVFGLK